MILRMKISRARGMRFCREQTIQIAISKI